MQPSEHARTALAAAEAAAELIRRYYREGARVSMKADRTPVTEADVAAERTIRAIIAERFPDHDFYGEETGRSGGNSPWLWLVDPIDGTKGFVRRYPFFSTQIALMHEGELVLGVSSAPEFGEIIWAERGAGAWQQGERLQVSAIECLEDATLSTGNIATLAAGTQWGALGRLITRVDRIRGYGDFYHYHLLARGSIDAVVESDVNILDIAALTVVVREAGGEITALDGAPVGLETTSVLASNARLQPLLVEVLSSGR